MKERICSYFNRWKLIEPRIGYAPALLLSAKMDRNVNPEENQNKDIDIYIITLGHSYIILGQRKESQEEGILLARKNQTRSLSIISA